MRRLLEIPKSVVRLIRRVADGVVGAVLWVFGAIVELLHLFS